jgi:hypothetical protein
MPVIDTVQRTNTNTQVIKEIKRDTNKKRTKIKYLNNSLGRLNETGLKPGGSSVVHIYTQIIHRIQRTEHT